MIHSFFFFFGNLEALVDSWPAFDSGDFESKDLTSSFSCHCCVPQQLGICSCLTFLCFIFSMLEHCPWAQLFTFRHYEDLYSWVPMHMHLQGYPIVKNGPPWAFPSYTNNPDYGLFLSKNSKKLLICLFLICCKVARGPGRPNLKYYIALHIMHMHRLFSIPNLVDCPCFGVAERQTIGQKRSLELHTFLSPPSQRDGAKRKSIAVQKQFQRRGLWLMSKFWHEHFPFGGDFFPHSFLPLPKMNPSHLAGCLLPDAIGNTFCILPNTDLLLPGSPLNSITCLHVLINNCVNTVYDGICRYEGQKEGLKKNLRKKGYSPGGPPDIITENLHNILKQSHTKNWTLPTSSSFGGLLCKYSRRGLRACIRCWRCSKKKSPTTWESKLDRIHMIGLFLTSSNHLTGESGIHGKVPKIAQHSVYVIRAAAHGQYPTLNQCQNKVWNQNIIGKCNKQRLYDRMRASRVEANVNQDDAQMKARREIFAFCVFWDLRAWGHFLACRPCGGVNCPAPNPISSRVCNDDIQHIFPHFPADLVNTRAVQEIAREFQGSSRLKRATTIGFHLPVAWTTRKGRYVGNIWVLRGGTTWLGWEVYQLQSARVEEGKRFRGVDQGRYHSILVIVGHYNRAFHVSVNHNKIEEDR
ncbi:putative signal peptide protein [Puccinia sorghi]|uniref:Putative signal peptide protein n=1 Tax=Puccinia sorghi TaxID=27349 RepID=A0A0L6UEL9_9BASI|nr:putative signal peptide protein [Puccinia sorghi]